MKDFATLFTGRGDVHGVYRLPKNASRSQKKGGKLVGAAQTLREPVTPALYAKHLAGEQMLGIVPIRLDGTCMWFAIDVDNYEDDLHPRLLDKITKLGLPLVVTTTKSGGAHLWCFLSDPIPAAQARDAAKAFMAKLGLPETTEIFPKQTHIKIQEEGSWINLPYFGAQRYCVGEDGKQKFTLQQFLEYANARIAHPTDLSVKKREKVAVEGDNDQTQAPPCIQRMSEEGVEEGRRNDALTQVAVYMRRAFPDDWQSRVKEWNDEHITPRLNMDEVARICGSVQRHDYQYLCTRFQDICDKQKCVTLKFGVGGGEGASAVVVFDRMQWIDGEQPFFRITMFGRTFQARPADLATYTAFRTLVLGHTGELIPMMKQPEWEKIVRPALAMKEDISAPSDTQMRDRVILKFQEWCSQSCARDDIALALARYTPYADKKSIYFRGDDFMKIADRVFPGITRAQVFVILRDWGVVQTKLTVQEKQVDLWMYPITGPLTWLDFKDGV